MTIYEKALNSVQKHVQQCNYTQALVYLNLHKADTTLPQQAQIGKGVNYLSKPLREHSLWI